MSWLARLLALSILLAQSLPAQVSWCTAPEQAPRACLDGGCCQSEQPAPAAPTPEQDCCQSLAAISAPAALTATHDADFLLGASSTPPAPQLPHARPERGLRPPATAPPTPHPFFRCIRLLI